jgi:hypothetical protein
MLKIKPTALDDLEARHSGIRAQIMDFENAELPPCPHCGSTDTAQTSLGMLPRSLAIASATTKLKLIPNGPLPGRYACNACESFFGGPG